AGATDRKAKADRRARGARGWERMGIDLQGGSFRRGRRGGEGGGFHGRPGVGNGPGGWGAASEARLVCLVCSSPSPGRERDKDGRLAAPQSTPAGARTRLTPKPSLVLCN